MLIVIRSGWALVLSLAIIDEPKLAYETQSGKEAGLEKWKMQSSIQVAYQGSGITIFPVM